MVNYWKKETIKKDYREVTFTDNRTVVGGYTNWGYQVPMGFTLMIDTMSINSRKSGNAAMLARLWGFDANQFTNKLLHIHGNRETIAPYILETKQNFPFGLWLDEGWYIQQLLSDPGSDNNHTNYFFHGWEVPKSGNS